MTSHCWVTAMYSSDVALIRHIVGDSDILETPNFTRHT